VSPWRLGPTSQPLTVRGGVHLCVLRVDPIASDGSSALKPHVPLACGARASVSSSTSSPNSSGAVAYSAAWWRWTHADPYAPIRAGRNLPLLPSLFSQAPPPTESFVIEVLVCAARNRHHRHRWFSATLPATNRVCTRGARGAIVHRSPVGNLARKLQSECISPLPSSRADPGTVASRRSRAPLAGKGQFHRRQDRESRAIGHRGASGRCAVHSRIFDRHQFRHRRAPSSPRRGQEHSLCDYRYEPFSDVCRRANSILRVSALVLGHCNVGMARCRWLRRRWVHALPRGCLVCWGRQSPSRWMTSVWHWSYGCSNWGWFSSSRRSLIEQSPCDPRDLGAIAVQSISKGLCCATFQIVAELILTADQDPTAEVFSYPFAGHFC
jgi:hypothetical protein